MNFEKRKSDMSVKEKNTWNEGIDIRFKGTFEDPIPIPKVGGSSGLSSFATQSLWSGVSSICQIKEYSLDGARKLLCCIIVREGGIRGFLSSCAISLITFQLMAIPLKRKLGELDWLKHCALLVWLVLVLGGFLEASVELSLWMRVPGGDCSYLAVLSNFDQGRGNQRPYLPKFGFGCRHSAIPGFWGCCFVS